MLTLEEFKRQNFLLREPGSGTREVFDRVTESAGFSVHPIWEAMSTTALVNGVMQGLGIAVLPQQMVTSALRSGQVISVEGFSVHPIWEAMSTTALVNGVMQGLGIAVLPQQMVTSALRSGQVISVDVEGLDFRRLFSIIYHKDKYLSPMAKAFVSLCQASAQHVPVPEYTGLY